MPSAGAPGGGTPDRRKRGRPPPPTPGPGGARRAAGGVAGGAGLAGGALPPGQPRRNVVTRGIDLPALVGSYFLVGDVLLFGTKRCPPCAHLERLTGLRLVKALAPRGGINAAVFSGGTVAEGDVVRPVDDA